MENKEEDNYKYKCENCKYYTNYESHWKIHIETALHTTGKRKKRNDTKEEYKCEKCEYHTKNVINMKNHTLNEHSDKEKRKEEFKYYCDYCDIGTFSKDIYEKHNNSKKHMNIINILNLIKTK